MTYKNSILTSIDRYRHYLFVTVSILLVLVLSLQSTYVVFAEELNAAEKKALYEDSVWYKNGLLSQNCSTSSGAGVSTGNNLDYAGNTILRDAELAAIKENQPFYETAAKQVDIPWQMIAVIHLRETTLARTNPSNGQGIYQFVDGNGGPYPAGAVSDDEFLRQTVLAAEFLKNKANANYAPNKNLTAQASPEAVKDTFYGYNGRGYADQAEGLGFNPETEAYEGSPYVMNKADARRDPAVVGDDGTWGQVKRDYGPIEYPANNDYGAFVVYAALTGISSTGCNASTVITEGGLNLEQAKAFMKRYGENVNGFSAKQSGALWDACNGGGSNCVTFSYFFNNTFTDLPAGMKDGNGEAIVGTLRSKGADGGSTPKVFSTFSWSGGTYGHTGIVLGIQGNEIIVGHASCSNPDRGEGDGTYGGGGSGFVLTGTLDDNDAFWGTEPSGFAYPGTVDTQAIQEFIDKGYVDGI